MIENTAFWGECRRSPIDIFSFHDLVYPAATPVDVMIILRISEKNNNAQIDDRISYERSDW